MHAYIQSPTVVWVCMHIYTYATHTDSTQPTPTTGGLDTAQNPIEDFELSSTDIAEAVPLPTTSRLPVCVSLNRIGNYLVVRCVRWAQLATLTLSASN